MSDVITLKAVRSTPAPEGVAVRTLKTEHQAVCQVLNVLDKAVLKLEETGEAPLAIFEDVLEFLTVFVDACHHTKEEEVLFPLMGRAGVPSRGGPIGVMLAEHQEGRELIARYRASLAALKGGDPSTQAALIEAARAYSALLRQHIQKENNVLFAIADRLFDSETQQEIFESFEEIEVTKLGAGTHERLHGKIEQMVEATAGWPGAEAGPGSAGGSCACH